MSEETTANPVVMAGDLITGPGLYEARCGEIVPITGWEDGWWVSYCDGVLDWFSSDGLQRCRANTDVGQWDLVRCVGRLAAPEPEPETTTQQLAEIDRDMADIERQVAELVEEAQRADYKTQEPHAAAIEELRSEVSHVQNLLGTEKRRVTELEELAASLRTINEAQEKAFEAAGKDNTALRNQLEAVKAELVQERLERNRWHNQVLRVTAELDEKTTQCEILRIELDAAQQVPADSPELRQLRADLEQMTLGRDTYRDGYERVLSDLKTIRETAKAEAVEAIVEWLVPIRTCGSQALATAVISNLPHIMRSVTGLEDEGIE